MFIGKGEMMYRCPMKEHDIFASKEGKCPECGMKMKKMYDKDKKKMHEMMKTHMAVDEKGEVIHKEKAKHEQMMKEKKEHKERMGKMMKHGPKNGTMLLKGEGEMTHKCPMAGHKVFSAESGKCPVCGMEMKKMSETDKKMMEKLKKDHKVIKKN